MVVVCTTVARNDADSFQAIIQEEIQHTLHGSDHVGYDTGQVVWKGVLTYKNG